VLEEMMRAPRSRKGFTLIELMVAIAILAILVTMAAPSFSSFIDKYRVKRAADTLSAFLINTKSEAIKRNTRVRAVFQSTGSSWCAGMTTADTCDCTAANSADSCEIDGAERVVRGSDFKDILLTVSADESKFSFTPLRGAVNAGNAQVTSANGLQVRVVVKNTTGRIRLCSPSGSGNVGGYPVC
jgi:prepilin-type N-terminal cleavage/methylation domain-containing protein